MAEEKSVAAAAAAPAEALALAADDTTTAALSLLLTHEVHAGGLLELGRISSCSKTLQAASGTAWNALFSKAARIASGPCVGYDPSRGCSVPCPCGYCDFVKWLNQRENAPGYFHGCFTNPDESVLRRVGHARATRCLLSTTCHKCGDLACRANPVTLNRTCASCAEKDEGSALILAKDIAPNFHLDDTDIVALPYASVDVSTGRSRGRSATVYLLSDVLAAAYAKFGGEEGFLAERERVLEKKRPTRQNPTRSAASDNPYKRAKVEETEFDPLSFRVGTAVEALPIGVMEHLPADHVENESGKEVWKSRQPIKCSFCDLESSPEGIRYHEWFAHGRAVKTQVQRGEVRQNMTESDFSSKYVQALGESEELLQLLDSASAQISYLKDKEWQEEEYLATNLTRWECKFDFGCGVSIGVAFREHSTDYVDGSVGVQHKYHLCIHAQIGGKRKPSFILIDYFQDMFNEYSGGNEAGANSFAEVIAALGLRESSPAQLLVSLMARVARPRPRHWQGPLMLISNVVNMHGDHSMTTVPVTSEITRSIFQILYPHLARG